MEFSIIDKRVLKNGLCLTYENGSEKFGGIIRSYFPKWEGWEVVDEESDKQKLSDNEELIQMVIDFYYAYFWHKMRLDEIHDYFVAEQLLYFAIHAGKKLTIKKVHRILGEDSRGFINPKTISRINSRDSRSLLHHLLLEMLEFQVQVDGGKCNDLVHVYYRIENFYS